MRNRTEKSLKLGIVALVCILAWLPCAAAFSAQEPNAPDEPVIRMLHVFVQADKEIVRFDNIWVIGRESADGPWRVQIDLPEGAELFQLDDPNNVVVSEDHKVIDVNMATASLVDSVGFSYLLPNKAGRCRLDIIPRHQVESAIVSVSGTGTGFSSTILSPSKFRRQRSRFSAVYVANSLSPATTIDLNLTALPRKDSFSKLLRTLCLVGLGLILAVAGYTMYRYPKSEVKDSEAHESGSK